MSVGAIGSIETDRITVTIAERYPDVRAAVGVHPHDAKDCDSTRIGVSRNCVNLRARRSEDAT